MSATTGQILRIVGLVIEMAGLYGAFGTGKSLRDVIANDLTTPPMLAVILGVLMWITGTIIIYSSKSRVRTATRSDLASETGRSTDAPRLD